MKYYFTLTILCCTFYLTAQTNLWSVVNQDQISLARNSEKNSLPSEYTALSLEVDALQKKIAQTPLEFSQQEGTIIPLPMPDGSMTEFEIWESPIMEPALAGRYPNIKTYKGKAVDDPLLSTRLGYSEIGFHAMIQSPNGAIFIDPLATQQTKYYTVSYAKHGTVSEEVAAMKLSCGTPITSEVERSIDQTPSKARNPNALVDLFVYRAAIACTGEYAEYHNATTKEAVLSHFTAILNRSNMVFERDIAVRMMLIADTDKLIFLDPATDPYLDGSNLVNSFSQNAAVLENNVGRDQYDIGHVFIAKCSANGGAVGLASSGSACEADKASGSSCQFYNDSRFAIELVCHEMGHQLAASHSWGNCPGSEGQLATGAAYEPGSGSTIMSYSGACGGDNNVQIVADDYFHSGSIEQMVREKNLESSCVTIIPTANNQPVITLPYEDGFYIPISTPFQLVGSATDEDGDALTYCWEQYNLGPAVTLGNPIRNAPSFRSFPPTTDPNRIFPRPLNLINNRESPTEVLPTYSRNLTFRLTVRDNNIAAGGVAAKNVSFEVTEAAGPFLITFPDKVADVLSAGAFAEITWDVAGTNVAPVNCQKVNILLSTDRGITYPHVLVANTENDGAQSVTIPDILTSKARIKVEAADNIFFDISNRDFSIISPTSSGFSFAPSIQTQQVCLPTTVAIDLATFSLLGFDEPITFIGPNSETGAFSTSFSSNTVNPGTTNQFSISFPGDYPAGDFSFDILGIAEGVDTVRRSISLELVSNSFSGFALTEPANNSSNIGLPFFQWTGAEDADLYEIEVATNPAFGVFIIDAATNLLGTTYTPSIPLVQSTIYYWRVRPINECGVGPNSEIFAFQTQNLSCTSEAATEVPLLISALGTPTIESKMTVTQNFEISDLNVPFLKGSHDWVSHIKTTLVSPKGTEAILFSGKCPGAVPINLGFDDESPTVLPCPPIGGQLHQPLEELAIFDGENTFGEWTLKIEVLSTDGEGGALDEWGVEFCGNLTLDAPQIITNEVLPVKPKSGRLINREFLLAEDANNTAGELVYTLVELPTIGSLLFNKTPVIVGAQFTQADLNNGDFKYRHDTEATEGSDQFTFTLSDGEGGWVGITSFEIIIDPSATTVSTAEVLNESLVSIFPNPAKNIVQVDLSAIAPKNALIHLFDVQGSLVYQQNVNNSEVINIITNKLVNGLYFIKIEMEKGVVTKKLVVQR